MNLEVSWSFIVALLDCLQLKLTFLSFLYQVKDARGFPPEEVQDIF